MTLWKLLPLAAAALCATSVQAQYDRMTLPAEVGKYGPGGPVPLTANTSAPTDWRLTSGLPFNGTTFDGVARLSFSNSGGSFICSGTLLSGGQYVLTAGHCADDFTSMQVDFGVYNDVASVTRGVSAAYVNPNWTGSNLAFGADIALLKLDSAVTGIQGFKLSSSNDVGKSMLIMGYGTTGTGAGAAATNWNDWGWGHWGYNNADVGIQDFDDATSPGNTWSYFGDEYIFDFDNGLAANNTLGLVAAATGASWGSSTGQGANEALTAGGDSGGGDFVWNGSEWLLSGVHSWGWQACGDFGMSCDVSPGVFSSYGDLSGSTAVFSHVAWIDAITAVPEPETYAMMLLGLGVLGTLQRRRQHRG